MNRTLFTFVFGLAGLMASAQLTVTAFDEALHTGANTIEQTFDFPDDISMYSQVLMHFHLSCPPGGCDPWDRYANFKVVKDGEKYEIGRYVTPYANDWCDWTLDVSAYRDLLQGEVTLESFIDTWSNGWEISVDFEFIEGVPEYAHTAVLNLWVDYFLIYGDTLFYSIDLPELSANIPANAEQTILRIMNTGHGQGNTDNAAEFSFRTHQIHVNGAQEFTQELWKDDCDVNPCSPQSGTWQFARAGWCPGQEIPAWEFDVTALVTPGETATFDYVLEPYYNFCSPWNPDCDNSVCSDCTYNGGTHTQPHYKIASQLVFYSQTPIAVGVEETEAVNAALNLYPNPTEDRIRINLMTDRETEREVRIYSNLGALMDAFTVPSGFGFNHRISTEAFPAGQYRVVVSDGQQTFQQTFIKH